MIRRPLNVRFRQAVLDGVKTTTIRDTAWPMGVPIMLYSWAGQAYRSKQIELGSVVVCHVDPIRIVRLEHGGLLYICPQSLAPSRQLHETEGFESRADMDAWFRAKVKPGQDVEMRLMHFRL